MTNVLPAGITIRDLLPNDSLIELTELLNRSYKQLADLGFRYVATYQDVEITMSRIAKGRCLVAVAGEGIVGAICYYPKENRDSAAAWYNNPGVATFGQFAVDPDVQGRGIGDALLTEVERLAQSAGASELALDTAEGATHLIAYYTKRGYRFVEYVNWEMTNYRSVILSKTLNVSKIE